MLERGRYMDNLTLETIKNYLRVDHDEDDLLINLFTDAAIKHIKDLTGLTDDEIFITASTGALGQDAAQIKLLLDDLVVAVLLLIGEFYDNRTVQVSDRLNTRINQLVNALMLKHSVNLI